MVGGDGRYRLVYNGEIYNFRELRAELEEKGRRFHTQSDTEALRSRTGFVTTCPVGE